MTSELPPLAYVLLSGGVDSATCVSEAVHNHSRRNVRCVSIDYGQRHITEINHAKQIAEYYGRPHEILKVEMPKTMLTSPEIGVPQVSYDELPHGVSPTYVPFRNGLMLATLASFIAGRHFDPTQAGRQIVGAPEGATERNPEYNRDVVIYFGAHAEDAANWAYPDCTPEFIGAMASALWIGTYQKLRLVAPWTHMMKSEIIHRGARLGTPYYLTWSCYEGGELHCGTCSTCRARKDAFKAAGIKDPTVYANEAVAAE